MSNFYCKLCGSKFSSIQNLTNGFCLRSPLGALKGRHELYEGSEKSQYFCKLCGQKFTSIQQLVNGFCLRSPLGALKGRHEVAL